MKPCDIIKSVTIKDRTASFGKILELRTEKKYIACDIFTQRGLNLTFGRNDVGTFVENMRDLCDVIEATYEPIW